MHAHREHSDETCSQIEKMNCNWMSDVDLDGLSKKQKVMVQKMLQEERNSFSCDGEIGKAEGLQMKCKSHRFYASTKELHINSTAIVRRSETLRGRLVKQGICSKISLFVLITSSLREKKNGILRLCIDYRQLNKKAAPYRHPLPRIQATLESLGGNNWFSVLDQKKAYHQGYIKPESRHKTAFITPYGLFEWVVSHLDSVTHRENSKDLWNIV